MMSRHSTAVVPPRCDYFQEKGEGTKEVSADSV